MDGEQRHFGHAWQERIGGARGGNLPPCPCPCPAGCLPQEKNLMVIKCPLVTIHMYFDLFNVIFATQHKYLWFFSVSNLKKKSRKFDFICSFHYTSKSLVFQLQDATISFRCTLQLNERTTFDPHQKIYCPCALALAPSFRFLAPPMQGCVWGRHFQDHGQWSLRPRPRPRPGKWLWGQGQASMTILCAPKTSLILLKRQ